MLLLVRARLDLLRKYIIIYTFILFFYGVVGTINQFYDFVVDICNSTHARLQTLAMAVLQWC